MLIRKHTHTKVMKYCSEYVAGERPHTGTHTLLLTRTTTVIVQCLAAYQYTHKPSHH